MANQNDTQAIVISLREEFRAQAIKSDSFQEQTVKLLKAHSEEIWGTGDDNIGLKAKMRDVTEDRKREKENRIWWRGAVGIPVIGLSIDKIVAMFTSIPK